MASVNKCILVGNLGRDPEIKMTPSGQKVANFSIATTEKFTDRNGQKQDKTEWHNIVIWGKLAEVVEKYVKKGSSVYLEGKITTRNWDDATTGKKVYKTEVVAYSMQMLGGSSEGRGQQAQRQRPPNSQQAPVADIPDDNLPF